MIDELKDALPDYAKDLKLNLSSVLAATQLTPQQLWGTALASAIAARNPHVLRIVSAEAEKHLSPDVTRAAKGAAAIMGMNNIYYRFTHAVAAKDYSGMRAGLRMNVNIGLGYLEAWLRGTGCVPLHNLMEDAATAEISRAQVWQWLKHGARLEDGRTVDRALVERIVAEERDKGGAARFKAAAELFGRLVTANDFVEFLTLPAYEQVD